MAENSVPQTGNTGKRTRPRRWKRGQWVAERWWADVDQDDAEEAGRLRGLLVASGNYPMREVKDDQYVENYRAVLRIIVDEANPTEITVLYRIARLLHIVPPATGFFEYIQAMQRERLAHLVATGQMPERVFKRLYPDA